MPGPADAVELAVGAEVDVVVAEQRAEHAVHERVLQQRRQRLRQVDELLDVPGRRGQLLFVLTAVRRGRGEDLLEVGGELRDGVDHGAAEVQEAEGVKEGVLLRRQLRGRPGAPGWGGTL